MHPNSGPYSISHNSPYVLVLHPILATSKNSPGYMVDAYGAAAKGMTLLHFTLGANGTASQSSFLDFVLDDAPLKQNL